MAQLRMLACELPDTDRLKLWHRMSLLATDMCSSRASSRSTAQQRTRYGRAKRQQHARNCRMLLRPLMSNCKLTCSKVTAVNTGQICPAGPTEALISKYLTVHASKV